MVGVEMPPFFNHRCPLLPSSPPALSQRETRTVLISVRAHLLGGWMAGLGSGPPMACFLLPSTATHVIRIPVEALPSTQKSLRFRVVLSIQYI